MNLNPVVSFIEGTRTTSRYLWPSVGHADPARPVIAAKASDARLVLVVAGLPHADGDFTVVGAFVREVIAIGGKFRLVVDAPFPQQAIDIEPIDPDNDDALETWAAARTSYDRDTTVPAQVETALSQAADPGSPLLQTHHKFIRWSEWDKDSGDLEPRGVILISPQKRLHALPFPGSHADAERWSRFGDVPPDALDQLPNVAGRTVHLSAPETIHAAGWEDAPERALHKFGADYYAETGRTAFP